MAFFRGVFDMVSHFKKIATKDKTIHRLVKTITCGVLVSVIAISPIQTFASELNTVTTTANVRMRSGASLDSAIVKTVPTGSAIRIINAENPDWFRVEFNGTQGYMYSEFLYSANVSLIVSANLRLRTGPSLGSDIIMTVPEGSAVRVISYVNNSWYRVEFNGEIGYMYSDFLEAKDEASPEVSTQTDAVPSNAAPIVDAPPVMSETIVTDVEGTEFLTTSNVRFRTEPSTLADIIKTVPSGSTVLVTGYTNDGWKRVSFDGSFGYMYADFLFDRSSISTPAVSPDGVERIHWSEARNNVIQTGVPLQITDVRTGITYWVRSFSNGNHADVETITAEDTALMLQAFGGQWTWTPRPVWVHVDGRTIAASINGMPHAGSTISGNNMNGHVCLHFYGSRTHNGSTGHERDHQAAVQEAFNAAR